MELIFVYLFFAIVLITISVITMRAIFKIPTIVENLEAQTRYLAEISKAQKEILAAQEMNNDNKANFKE